MSSCVGFYILIFFLAALNLSCGTWDFVLQPGIKPTPPALEEQSLNHWTTREFLLFEFELKADTCPQKGISESANVLYQQWATQFQSRE